MDISQYIDCVLGFFSFPLYPQDMWKEWQRVHGLWFFVSQHASSWGCHCCFTVLAKFDPTSWALCGLDWHDLIMSHDCHTFPIYPYHKTCEWVVIHPWQVVHHITTYTTMKMTFCFAGSAQCCPTTWVVCSLDGYDSSVLIVSSIACQTLPMHPQEMHNEWYHIHDLGFSIPQLIPPWCWHGALQFLPNPVQQIGSSVAWMDRPQCIDWVPGLSDLVRAHTRHVELVATPPWHVVLYVIMYTILGMTWWSCSSLQIWSANWLLYSFDGWHHIVFLTVS